MKALVEKINELCIAFAVDAQKNSDGNKAAGLRARKTSLELEKKLKEFRKISISESK